MADRERNYPHQVDVHPHRHFDHNTGGKNYQSGPSKSQVLAVLTLLPVASTLLALAKLTLKGTVIRLALATPLFIIFSPDLVPGAIAVSIGVAVFFSFWAFQLTGLSSLYYLFNRFRGLLASSS
ncbi:hypothetical protein DITRI_Ditri16bG0135200 [Diplodiscus trichospermus]